MNALLDKLKKNTTIKETNVLSESKLFSTKDLIQTSVPALNVALSGMCYQKANCLALRT